MQNSAGLVFLLYHWELFIGFSICLNLKCEENFGIQKQHELKLRKIFLQPAVTWNPWALHSCRKKSISESIMFGHEYKTQPLKCMSQEWRIRHLGNAFPANIIYILIYQASESKLKVRAVVFCQFVLRQQGYDVLEAQWGGQRQFPQVLHRCWRKGCIAPRAWYPRSLLAAGASHQKSSWSTSRPKLKIIVPG